jgi:hypothetical protein
LESKLDAVETELTDVKRKLEESEELYNKRQCLADRD